MNNSDFGSNWTFREQALYYMGKFQVGTTCRYIAPDGSIPLTNLTSPDLDGHNIRHGPPRLQRFMSRLPLVALVANNHPLCRAHSPVQRVAGSPRPVEQPGSVEISSGEREKDERRGAARKGAAEGREETTGSQPWKDIALRWECSSASSFRREWICGDPGLGSAAVSVSLASRQTRRSCN